MTDYRVAQKIIHWVLGLIICIDLFVASKFGNPMEIADRLESRGDHSSLGIIVTILLCLRILMRVAYGAPPLPVGMAPWQLTAAKVGHGLMYFAMVGLVATGIASALNATEPVIVFQSISIGIGNLDEAQFQFIRQFHDLFTYLMIALIFVHVGAALFHSFVLKDDSTRRMLRFWTSSKGT